MTRRSRRGSRAVEFALILPVLLAFLFGIMDYGWFFNQQIAISGAVRDGARAGSTTPQDEGGDPVLAAEQAVARALAAAGFRGEVQLDAALEGDAPDQAIRVAVSAPYDGLTGFVPVPGYVAAQLTMRMEDQPGVGE
ncbi:MAG: pilus assembly protein [Deltaproteobacteria bacterium]|nr:pilus assembly protein [Deltaproteobacteria bacterium]